jgi:Zn-dependent protease
MMDNLTLTQVIQIIIVRVLPLIFAITVHEVAHGWVAKQYGDNTASSLGRLTLNPIKHIDLIGTIILPVLLLMTGASFIFGWAKPVPVDPRNFKNPVQDMAIVALAGPVSNLLMAIAWVLIARFGVTVESQIIIQAGFAGLFINLSLALINLLPIPPLDGSRILTAILPIHWARQYNRLERYGFIILLALLYFKVLNVLLEYPLFVAQKVFSSIAGL